MFVSGASEGKKDESAVLSSQRSTYGIL